MLNRFLVFLLAICLCAGGCSDERLSPVIQVVGRGIFEADVDVQTEIPPVVWESMKKHQEQELEGVKSVLDLNRPNTTYFTPLEVRKQRKEMLIRNGAEDVTLEFLMALHKDYYNRYVDADGIAIMGNADLEDKHFREARDVVLVMTAKRPELREAMRMQNEGFYMSVYDEIDRIPDASELPENYIGAHVYKQIYGPSGSCGIYNGVPDPPNDWTCYAVIGQATVFVRSGPNVGPGTVYAHNVCHEFAHALDIKIKYLDPSFLNKLMHAYDTAKELGIWERHYAGVNHAEYWAEGAVMWFYDIGPRRLFETRASFFEYDPLLAELLSEWFPVVSFPLNY